MILEGRHIFIVEDDIRNRIVYQILMVRSGAQVEFDRWGRDTLDQMKKYREYDLIILDLMLPKGTSGFDIYDKIRADGAFDDVPIVAVSAADPSYAIPKAKQMGFSGFIAKPINDMVFPDQLARIIAGEKVWSTDDGSEI